MSARAEIFANVRHALAVSGNEAPRRRSVEDRLRHAPQGVIPARGQGDAAARLALFRDEAERVSADVTELESAQQIPAAIATFLHDRNLPARLRCGSDPYLAALSWEATGLHVEKGRADPSDLVCVSHAFAGVAETGTLVLTSGGDNPTTLNFLPDTHIVVLNAADIVGDYEAAWQKLRMVYGKGLMPRTVNFITGPSRSADIGHSLLLGAHGPRTLHILVVNEGA
ncbi:MAG: lactate utilization protein [Beijerinckiaceae bacterium]|nr:MAG: lactate utilization protein [Beijerinckiaceae bacterium]